jgi:hypothetical protein
MEDPLIKPAIEMEDEIENNFKPIFKEKKDIKILLKNEFKDIFIIFIITYIAHMDFFHNIIEKNIIDAFDIDTKRLNNKGILCISFITGVLFYIIKKIT